MSRIYQYPVVTEIGSDDYLALGSASNGSRAILASDLAPVIGNKTITERGTYKASDDNMDGYGQVTVDIPYTDIHMASGDIATFEGEDLPLKSLKVSVTPYQDLSHGDPSPENICPIIGWDEVNVYDDAVYGGTVAWNQLIPISSNSKSATINNVTYTDNRDGTYTVVTSGSASANTNIIITPMSYKAGHIYACFGCPSGGSTSTYFFFNGGIEEYGGGILYKRSADANANIRIYVKNGTTISSSLTFIPQIFDLTQMFGSTIADEIYAMEQAQAGSGVAYFKSLFYKDYYPYNSGEITNVSAVNGDTDKYLTYTIDLDGTRYGGVLDATNGTMDDTLDHIASYNGETLPSTWISDRDVYTEGTTPTIGAEVVYTRATPITVQLAPTPVKSIEGENNISANCGQITEVKYFKKA